MLLMSLQLAGMPCLAMCCAFVCCWLCELLPLMQHGVVSSVGDDDQSLPGTVGQ